MTAQTQKDTFLDQLAQQLHDIRRRNDERTKAAALEIDAALELARRAKGNGTVDDAVGTH